RKVGNCQIRSKLVQLISHQTKNIPRLLRQLKAWLPHAEVLSPDWIRYLLKQELQTYLDSTK
ncbi:hypothetical protein EEJ32_00545, partial [Vibrio cholerae]